MQKEIQINDSAVNRLITLNKNKHLAHAYLFIGPKDSGKGETALTIAKIINCEKNIEGKEIQACDGCPSCVKVNAGHHPDIHITESAYGDTIKIEEVRDLLDQIRLRPFMGVKKIFIMKNIENLTAEAGNALLKTLEEPSANSLLLLTTSVLEKNLDTIKSRCHAIYFLPTANNRLAEVLTKYHHQDPLDAHFLAYFSEGCLGKAKKLKDDKIIERKNDIIDRFILSDGGEAFLKEILAEKDKTKEFLDILLCWVHDALLVKAQAAEENLINQDRVKDLNKFQLRHSFAELESLYEEIVKMCQWLDENLNLKMPLLIIKERLHG